MSLDGTPIQIPKKINSPGISTRQLKCGGIVYESATGPFYKCSIGHTHCRDCLDIANRFKKGFTCNCKIRN